MPRKLIRPLRYQRRFTLVRWTSGLAPSVKLIAGYWNHATSSWVETPEQATQFDTEAAALVYRRGNFERMQQAYECACEAVETSHKYKVAHDPDIERLLWNSYPATMHSADEAIYAMRPDLTLAYVNLGWMRFAAQNGGEPTISSNWPIGCRVLTAMAAILRPFFAKNYAKCLREQRPWEHHYECSSPELYRSFVMMTYPLGAGEGLLTVNSLVQETRHTRNAEEPIDGVYRNEQGFVLQCCHCRRVRRCGAEPHWDWVPNWVRACPTNTSHGLCEPCFGFYHRSTDDSANGFPDTFRTGE